MTNRLFIFISFGLLFCCSCGQKKYQKVDLLSDDIVKIDKACFELGEAKDTSAVRLLLNHIKDPRITHNLHFKGASVYQCRIGALRKISGLDFEKKITHEIDTNAINFYIDWAINNGHIKDRSDIQKDLYLSLK